MVRVDCHVHELHHPLVSASMKTLLPTVALAIFTTVLPQALAEEHYEEKPIKVQKAGAFDKDKQVIIEVGEKVTHKIKIYQGEFFGATTIMASSHMTNTTDQKIKAVYAISFHDKDGKLVGCHQGSWDLEPKEDIQYGSGIIYADEKSITSVSSYKLRVQATPSKK